MAEWLEASSVDHGALMRKVMEFEKIKEVSPKCIT
jgi:hypothetical protein